MTTSSPDARSATVSSGTASPRVGVAGLGRVGLECAVAVALHPELSLAGFVEPRAPLRAFARGCGFAVPAAATLARRLAIGPLDALVVCAPPGERAPLVEAAVDAGLAVLAVGVAEGPADEAARIAAALARATRPVAAGNAVWFHPLFARVRDVLASGALGAPRRVRGSAHVSRVFAAGVAPPGLDALAFAGADLVLLVDALLGPAQAVRAEGQRLYGSELDDVRAQMRLAGGLEVGLDVSWSNPDFSRMSLVLEVETERGRVLASDDALEISDQPGGPAEMRVRRLVLAEEEDAPAFESGEPGPLVDAFARLLRGDAGAQAGLDPARAARVAHVLDAARRSGLGDGAWIEVAT